jgi:hypothetical protein
MKPKYRTIPAHGQYPGLTELKLPCGRCFVTMGVGKAAETALQERAANN